MRLPSLIVLAITVLVGAAHGGEAPALQTEKERISYAAGVELARNLLRSGVDLEVDVLIQAMKATLAGEDLLMNELELRAAKNAYQTAVRRNFAESRKAALEENKKASDAFLAENKTKQGVVTLPSGLQYKVLKAGDGKKPTDADTVDCLYRGTLVDGTEFDSTYKSGQPKTFKVTAVIPGWREALKLMPAGSKWQVVVPPQLGYGERGSGQRIPPNAALIFDLELVAVK
jgi:FKBP-type peptidyl-prolyl cis-trans isomerase FklB